MRPNAARREAPTPARAAAAARARPRPRSTAIATASSGSACGRQSPMNGGCGTRDRPPDAPPAAARHRAATAASDPQSSGAAQPLSPDRHLVACHAAHPSAPLLAALALAGRRLRLVRRAAARGGPATARRRSTQRPAGADRRRTAPVAPAATADRGAGRPRPQARRARAARARARALRRPHARAARPAPAGTGPTHVVAGERGLAYVTDTAGDALLVFATRGQLRVRRRYPLLGAPYAIGLGPAQRRACG